MIEVIAENYGIPSSKIQELVREFKRSGVLRLLFLQLNQIIELKKK